MRREGKRREKERGGRKKEKGEGKEGRGRGGRRKREGGRRERERGEEGKGGGVNLSIRSRASSEILQSEGKIRVSSKFIILPERNMRKETIIIIIIIT